MATKQKCTWKSIAAGALGGLAASFAMNQFQSLLSKAQEALSAEKPSAGSGGDDATVKTAQAIADVVCHCELSDSDKKWAGPAVHYTFGTTMGAAYGALAAYIPEINAGKGTAFGTALWLGADEVAIPSLGLGSAPAEMPLSSHASALAAHLVYGWVTYAIRRTVLQEAS